MTPKDLRNGTCTERKVMNPLTLNPLKLVEKKKKKKHETIDLKQQHNNSNVCTELTNIYMPFMPLFLPLQAQEFVLRAELTHVYTISQQLYEAIATGLGISGRIQAQCPMSQSYYKST